MEPGTRDIRGQEGGLRQNCRHLRHRSLFNRPIETIPTVLAGSTEGNSLPVRESAGHSVVPVPQARAPAVSGSFVQLHGLNLRGPTTCWARLERQCPERYSK